MSRAPMRRFSPAFLVTVVALAGSLVGPSAASAVTRVGETFPGATGSCDTGTALQSRSPGSPPHYAAPSAGVITAWSFHATPIAPTVLKLKVARPAGGNTFTIVGESPPKSPAGGVLSTYTDVRIAVSPGDVIGFYVESASDDAECFRSAPDFGFHYGIDRPPGSTAEYIPAALSSQMSISAVLEPDCDKDKLGDETQDTNTASCLSLRCGGHRLTVVGTEAPNTIRGTAGRDVIAALGGNDKVSGLGGNDLVCGGGGKDTLKGGKGKDSLLGQKGKDTLGGGKGKDICRGGKGNDTATKCEVEKSL